MSKPLDACPHCGGNGGICVDVKQEYTHYYAWDGENLCPSEPNGPPPRTARCVDCRKPVTKWAKHIETYEEDRQHYKHRGGVII